MAPMGINQLGSGYVIIHHCQKCGYQKRNKAATDDDFNCIIEVSENRD